jgi:hypothetical protein
MTMYAPIWAHPSIDAVNGDQDRDVQNTRYGRTVRISTPQLPFVVSFPSQNAQLVIQPAATAPRCATNQKKFGSMERPCCQLSIELFCFDFFKWFAIDSIAWNRQFGNVGSRFGPYYEAGLSFTD